MATRKRLPRMHLTRLASGVGWRIMRATGGPEMHVRRPPPRCRTGLSRVGSGDVSPGFAVYGV